MSDRAKGVLQDQVILIIGGSTGIGYACTLACLEEGALVSATSHDQASLNQLNARHPGSIQTILADARNSSATNRAIAETVERYGRLDGLVHVAGGSGRAFGDGPLHEITEEGWSSTIELNLTSVFLSNQAAVRQFLAQGSAGAIVNVGSVLARHPASHHFGTHAYASAKSGLEGFSHAVAGHYAKDNIRVNVVSAGLTDTPMAARAMSNSSIKAFVESKQPLDGGRAAVPEDFGGAITFLLSQQARFITGQVLGIDGGWSVSDGQVDRSDKAAPKAN